MDFKKGEFDAAIFGPGNIMHYLQMEGELLARQFEKPCDLNICFSYDRSFNAVAYLRGSSFVSSINLGAVLELYHHALSLLTFNEILPALGLEMNSQKCISIWDFERPKIYQLDNGFNQIDFYAGPENPIRLQAAELIALFAIEFLMFHEIGHVFGGHLLFLNNSLQIDHLSAQNREGIIETTLHQTIEMDADAIAICFLLENTDAKKEIHFRNSQSLDLSYASKLLSIAVTIVFFLLDSDSSDRNKLSNSLYLPRDYRFSLVQAILISKLKKDYKDLLSGTDINELTDLMMQCSQLLAYLYRKETDKSALEFISQIEVDRYYEEVILKKWIEIRDDIQKLAFIQLPK